MQAPQKSYLSNTTGTWIGDEEARDPEYWVKHLRQTVRFGENVRELLGREQLLLLEVGPGNVLSSLARGRERARWWGACGARRRRVGTRSESRGLWAACG